MDPRQSSISVLIHPWLAHGHISPFLELAMKLTERNFYIYFCSTPVNLNSIKPNLSEKYSSSIQFVELHIPSLPELPPHYHTTKGLPPRLNNTLKKALDMSSPSFSNILKTLNPDLLIYDFFQPWAPAIASSHNIPAINFLSIAASMGAFFVHGTKNPGDKFPFPEIYSHGYEEKGFIHLLENSTPDGTKCKDRVLECIERSSDIILIKTYRELEAKYIDYLSVLVEKKMVPVGPLVQDLVDDDDDDKSDVIEWLDKKERFSAGFVSFGSEYFLSKEEREEIAHGLELSEVNFIWVVRFHVEEQIKLEEVLPEGFVERVGERGIVLEGWAPQIKILGHSSIGGFVSHCGWSSVMESMKIGVPIIAMPMHLDQPLNARLVKEAGVGLEVKRNKNGGLEREEVAKVIKEVVLEKNGECVRKKAKEMSESIRKKGEEEMDGVVDELVQLCGMRKCQRNGSDK